MTKEIGSETETEEDVLKLTQEYNDDLLKEIKRLKQENRELKNIIDAHY